ncbi:glycine zipper family protein, partial [Corynebacterium pseudodiphtheriticum]
MKRIWRLAGVGLLMVTVSAQVMADDPRSEGGGQHERGPEGGRQGNEPPRPQNNQPRPQNQHFENNAPRPQNEHFERGEQQGHGQWQGRPQGAESPRPAPQPANNLPIQGRPDTVRQTQEPRQGYYQDIPRRNDGNPHWQPGNGPGPRP